MRRIRTAYLFFFLFLGLFSFVIGLLYQVYLFSLGAIFSVWILSMIYAIADLNKRYVFALFNVTFFTFLLSRLFISPIFGELQSEAVGGRTDSNDRLRLLSRWLMPDRPIESEYAGDYSRTTCTP